MSLTVRPPSGVSGQKASVSMGEPLFRSEVIAERQTQWLGTVLLAPSLSHGLFATFAALVTAAILALLFFADYTRKAHINGWLVPQQGVVRIFVPQPGVVRELYVQEGMEVRKGSPLLVLSTELQSEVLGATREEIVHRLIRRRDSMAAEQNRQDQLHLQQMEDLSQRLSAVRSDRCTSNKSSSSNAIG